MRVVSSPNRWCCIWPRFWFLSTQYIILRATQSDTPCFSVPSSCWWWWWWHFLRNGRPNYRTYSRSVASTSIFCVESVMTKGGRQKLRMSRSVRIHSIQFNTIQYNSIQLIKLFWHLPLTIFAASPYQPPSHIYILKRADQNRFVKTKKIGRDIAVLPSCPMRAPLMNWFQLSFLTAWFSGSFRSDLRPFSIVFYGC